MGVQSDIQRAELITLRIQAESRSALLAWAIVEASGFLWDKGRQTSSNIFSLRWTGPHRDIFVVSLREALLALCRLSEPAVQDQLCIAQLEKILKSDKIQAELINRARLWNDPLLQLQDDNAQLCRREIEWFLGRCGRRCRIKNCKYYLKNFWEPLRSIRHENLAHALESQTSDGIEIRHLRLLLILTSRMAQSASLFVLGQAYEPFQLYRIKLAAQKHLCKALEDFEKVDDPQNWHNIHLTRK